MAIIDCETLETWLADKPDDVSRIVALRMALRLFPLGLDRMRFANDRMHQDLVRVMTRALIVSWYRIASAAEVTGHDVTGAQSAYIAAQHADGRVIAEICGAVSHAASAACAIWQGDAAECAVATAYNAEIGLIDAEGAVAIDSFWRAIAADCRSFDQGATVLLPPTPLWPDGAPRWFVALLDTIDSQPWQEVIGYRLWRDWYAGRIEGRSWGFAADPDIDSDIGQRLMAADDRWWERDFAIINAEVSGWLA